MQYSSVSCEEFTNLTFSKEPVPGGGGVSALAGALGAALGGMVCNLTSGKKKYAQYEEDIQRITNELSALKDEFIAMIDEDAKNFYPLSEAYKLPSSTDEEKNIKAQRLEECLKVAIKVPVSIVKASYNVLGLFEELSVKGSTLALSDVGCGVALLRSALTGGWLNVVINLNMIKDETFTKALRNELEPIVTSGKAKCDEIYEKVLTAL